MGSSPLPLLPSRPSSFPTTGSPQPTPLACPLPPPLRSRPPSSTRPSAWRPWTPPLPPTPRRSSWWRRSTSRTCTPTFPTIWATPPAFPLSTATAPLPGSPQWPLSTDSPTVASSPPPPLKPLKSPLRSLQLSLNKRSKGHQNQFLKALVRPTVPAALVSINLAKTVGLPVALTSKAFILTERFENKLQKT